MKAHTGGARWRVAVGDGAVADLEQPLELLPQRRRGRSKPARDHGGQEQQPLEAPADHHEPPAVILRHVIVREAGESRQRDQQSIERLARVDPRILGAPIVARQNREGAPVLGG